MMTSDRAKSIALAAAALAAPMEGMRQIWYYDPPGIPTVCYGHTGDVDRKKVYTKDECLSLLNRDMMKAVLTVERCHPGLPDRVLISFSDAVYNLGPAVACDKVQSTPSRRLDAGDYKGACEALLNWDRATLAGVKVRLPGLTRRRHLERDFCIAEGEFHVEHS